MMEDQQLEKLKSNLNLRNIIIDKAIIGIIIIFFGWWLSIQLEELKSEIRMNESAQNLKIKAISAIQGEISNLFTEFTKFTSEPKKFDYEKWKEEHDTRVNKCIDKINKNSLYISTKLDKELQIIVDIHTGLSKVEKEHSLKYTEMAFDLFNIINSILRYETGIEINRDDGMDKYINNLDRYTEKPIEEVIKEIYIIYSKN
jgi:hypothetical protein